MSQKPISYFDSRAKKNHSSVGSCSDEGAFSNSGNSAEDVTKKNVQEFSHVLSNPCEPVISSESKMFKPQVTVTFQPWVFSRRPASKLPPTNFKELKSFLGLANNYRRFEGGFSNIADYLNTLTKKNVPFVRTEACTEAFDKLKRALVLAPFLAYPNFGEPFLFLLTLAPRVLVLPHQKFKMERK